MNTVRLAKPDDAEELLAIYAPFVTGTAVSFELEPPSVEEMARRISETLPRFPWLVFEQGERVMGYAYASTHRARAAYQWCVEVSVYVHPDARRGGIARQLYTELLSRLREQGFYNAYAGITLPNPASIGFHEAMGFQLIGVYPQIGYKHGRWHDVGWWRLRLRDDEGEPAPPLPQGNF